jgi:hypothetical protein
MIRGTVDAGQGPRAWWLGVSRPVAAGLTDVSPCSPEAAPATATRRTTPGFGHVSRRRERPHVELHTSVRGDLARSPTDQAPGKLISCVWKPRSTERRGGGGAPLCLRAAAGPPRPRPTGPRLLTWPRLVEYWPGQDPGLRGCSAPDGRSPAVFRRPHDVLVRWGSQGAAHASDGWRSPMLAVAGPLWADRDREMTSASRNTLRTFPPISRMHSSWSQPLASSSAISAG